MADGEADLLAMADAMGRDVGEVRDAADVLAAAGLLEMSAPGRV
jgi:aminopeptidase-like protein